MPGLSILLVEDDFIIAWHLREMLVGMGHRICATATRESEAVELEAKHEPDVVVMDLRLADGGNGASAAERIRSRRTVPVLFCTAHGDDPEFRSRIAAMDKKAVISKPIREDQLREGIAACRSV